MNVLYHYETGPELERSLVALEAQGIRVRSCPQQDERRLFELLPETEVLWHCLYPVDEALLSAAPRLRLIQKIGVGVNTIDLEAARRRGIAVANMPGSNSRAVAEQSLALMLAVLRQIPRFDRELRAGPGWRWDARRQDGLGELYGCEVGLVGFGAIPRVLASLLEAFGARVSYTARSVKADVLYPCRPLEELLARSDIVSLHLPLTTETRGLLDRRRLSLLRPEGILINTARGALIDEAALARALAEGRLRGAGLDAFATEPLPEGHPFHELPNLVMTPHVAWLTRATLERSLEIAVTNCRRLAAGEPLLHRVQ